MFGLTGYCFKKLIHGNRNTLMMRFALLGLACLVILSGCSLDSVFRSDKPVSREMAAKVISLPLPVSAKDIYYYTHSEGMVYEGFFRFKVNSEDIKKTIENITAEIAPGVGYDTVSVGNDRWKDLLGDSLKEANVSPPMEWWDIYKIKNGYCCSSKQGTLNIFVNVSDNIVYVFRTD